MTGKSRSGRMMPLASVITVLLLLSAPMLSVIPNISFNAPSLSADDSADVTYDVVYDANSGTGNVPSQSSYGEGDTVTVSFDGIPYMADNVFVGWTSSSDNKIYRPEERTNDPVTAAEQDGRKFTMPASAVTMTAVWKPVSDNGTFDLSGGSITISYDTSANAYSVRQGSGTTVVDGNVIKVTGTGANNVNITVASTAERDTDDQLYLLLAGVKVTVTSATNGINVQSGYVNMQLQNENTITNNSPTTEANARYASVRVPAGSEILMIGQGNTSYSKEMASYYAGSLKITQTLMFSLAAGIGGNGATSGDAEDAGILGLEYGYVKVNAVSRDNIASAGIGGGGTRSAAGGNGGDGAAVTVNGGFLDVTVDTGAAAGNRSLGAAIGGGGAYNTGNGNGGAGGMFAMNGGKVTINSIAAGVDPAALLGAGIGGGGAWYGGNGGKGPNAMFAGGTVSVSLTGESTGEISGAGIGGGGSFSTSAATAGSGGNVTIRGDAAVNVTMVNNGADISSAGIGGGSSSNAYGTSGSGGTIAIEGGNVSISMTAGDYGLNGAGIGGGGSSYYGYMKAGSGGDITITGGTIAITQTGRSGANAGITGAGIGGGGIGSASTTSTAGAGGMISISNAAVTITQGNSVYGNNGAGIGGGGSENSPGAAGGDISITSSDISITKTSTGSSNNGAGIGGGGSRNSSAGAGGTTAVTQSDVRIYQSTAATSGSGITGAGIGGGGTNGTYTPGAGGTITLTESDISIYKTAPVAKSGAGIGGGGYSTRIAADSGAISIKDSCVDMQFAGNGSNPTVSIGGYNSSNVNIEGGTITSLFPSSESSSAIQDIGKYNQSGGQSNLTITYGAVKTTRNDGTLTNVFSKSGSHMYRVIIGIESPTDADKAAFLADRTLYSFLIRCDVINDGRYFESNITRKHLDSMTAGSADGITGTIDNDTVDLYLPALLCDISVELTEDGKVLKYQMTASASTVVTADDTNDGYVFYRVVFRGTGVRLKDDTVHVQSGMELSDEIEVHPAVSYTSVPFKITSFTVAGNEVDQGDENGYGDGTYLYYNLVDQTSEDPAGTVKMRPLNGKTIITAESQSSGNIVYRDTIGGTSATRQAYLNVATPAPDFDDLFQNVTHPGYGFIGWSETSGATEADYEPGVDITPTSRATTLYSVWSAAKLEVTIEDGDFDVVSPAPIETDGDVYEAEYGKPFVFDIQATEEYYDIDMATISMDGIVVYSDDPNVTVDDSTYKVNGGHGHYIVDGITKDVTMSISLAKMKYTVTVPEDSNFFTVSPPELITGITVEHGTDVVFDVTSKGAAINLYNLTASGATGNPEMVDDPSTDGLTAKYTINVIGDTVITITPPDNLSVTIHTSPGASTDKMSNIVSSGNDFTFSVYLEENYSPEYTVVYCYNEGDEGNTVPLKPDSDWIDGTAKFTIRDVQSNIVVMVETEKVRLTVSFDDSEGLGTMYGIKSDNLKGDPDNPYDIWIPYGESASFTIVPSGENEYDVNLFTIAVKSNTGTGRLVSGEGNEWHLLSVTGDMVLEITPAKKVYGITFNFINCSAVEIGTSMTVTSGESTGEITIMWGAGYEFKSRSVSPDREISFDPATGILKIDDVTGNMTVTLEYVLKEVTLTYHPNGGEWTSSSRPSSAGTYTYGDAFNVSFDARPVRFGHVFMGWSDDPDADYPKYAEGSDNNLSVRIYSDTRLFAVWGVRDDISISYESNWPGSQGPSEEQNGLTFKKDFTPLALPDSFKLDGYTFRGWSTDPAGGGTWFVAGAADSGTVDFEQMVLYAQWAANVSLTYDMNGGTDDPMYEKVTGSPGMAVIIPADPVRDGYSFEGWRDPVTSIMYTAGQDITVAADMVLIATWTPKEVVLTFANMNGTPDTTVLVKVGDMYVMPGAPSTVPDNKYFVGWLYGGTVYVQGDILTIVQDMIGGITLTAQWGDHQSTVYFRSNGGTGTVMPITGDPGTPIPFPAAADGYVREGYTMIGWALSPTETSPSSIFNETTTTQMFPQSGMASYYAIWEADPASLTYDGNGHKAGAVPTEQTGVTDGTVTVSSIGSMDRPGYTFMGWNTSADGTGTMYFPGNTITLFGMTTLYAQWTPNEITVDFDLNGGAGTTPDAISETYDDSSIPQFTVPTIDATRDGYRAAAWNTKADGTGTAYMPGTVDIPTEDVTLYIVWTPEAATVTYSAEGATGTIPTGQTGVTGDTHTVQGSGNLAVAGSAFLGWNTSEDGTGTWYFPGDTMTMIGDVTLYAQWSPGSVIVYFNANGGTGSVSPITGSIGETISFPELTGYDRPGYRMIGWALSPDETSAAKIYSPGTGDGQTFPDTNVSYYAIWEAETASLEYLGNGHKAGNVPEGQTGVTGDTAIISSIGTMDRPGYTFTGWNTSADGTGTMYFPGNSITLIGDMELHAIWSPDTITVAFDLNGGTGTVPAAISETYDDASVPKFKVPAIDASKIGYTASEMWWSPNPDGSGMHYIPGETMDIPTQSITLYIHWSPMAASVAYNANGGSGDTPDGQAGWTDDIHTVSAPDGMSMANHTFTGWNTSRDGKGTWYFPGDTMTMIGDVTLYAQWSPGSVIVYFSANGGTGSVSPITGNFNEIISFPALTGYVRHGYTMAGWALSPNETDASKIYGPGTAAGQRFPGENISYNAIWKADPAYLAYDGNGHKAGTVPGMQAGVTGDSVTVSSIGNMGRTGYTFDGWNTKADGTGVMYNPGNTVTLSGTTTLYAQWSPNGITVEFDLNGGTGTIPIPVHAVYNDTDVPQFKVPAITATRDGYTFDGWNTRADGNGMEYVPGTMVGIPSANVTLYIIWMPESASVTYDGNDTDENVPTGQAGVTGDGHTVSTPGAMSVTGYTFAGWNTKADGTGQWYQPGEVMTMIGDVTLYAQWSAEPAVIVHFNANGGIGSVAPVTGIPGETISFPALTGYTRAGYTLMGWALSSTETDASRIYGPSTADQTFPEGNVSYYAIWKADDALLVYNGNGHKAGDVPATQNGVTDETVEVGPTGDMGRPGYTFTGWNTKADGSGDRYFEGNTVVLFGMTTLYAQWSPNGITAEFDLNGGTGTIPIPVHVVYNDTDVPQFRVPAITAMRDGYTASASWFTAADGSGDEYIPGTTVDMPSASITLYIVWTPKPASVTYDGNGTDENVPTEHIEVTGAEHTVSPPGEMSMAGYAFMGWNTKADGTGQWYQPCDVIAMIGDVTLYAQWSAEPAAIVYFNANGGIGSVAPVTGIAGNAIPFPELTGYTMKGYTLIGWALSSTETDASKIYGPSTTDQLFPEGNVSYHAIWKADDALLVYDGNGHKTGDIPEMWDGVTGDKVQVTAAGGMGRPGYTFTGWNTEADGSGDPYSPGNPITLSGTITLYAQWSPNTVTVDFDLNGGTGTVPGKEVMQYDDTDVPQFKVPSIDATRDGYKASSVWYTSPDGTGSEYVPGYTVGMPSSDITLYVHWIPLPASVSYDANGGSDDVPEEHDGIAGDLYVVQPNVSVMGGYTFIGWNTSKDGTGQWYQPGEVMTMIGNVTLYAQWSADPVVIVYFNANGGTGSVAPVTGSSGDVITFPPLTGYVRQGYTLMGWALSPDETDASKIYDQSTADQSFPDTNVSYYAIWEADPAGLTYNGNGVTAGVPDEIAGVTGDRVTVTVGSMGRPGYAFIGWNTSANGSGDWYFPGNTITLSGTITLYAQWSPNGITVEFDLNDGIGTIPKPVNAVYDDSAVPQFRIPSITATRHGYAPAGWNTAADGSGSGYVPGTTASIPSESMTLYVIWEPTGASVAYDANGIAADVPDRHEGITGDEYTVSAPGEAPGYVFIGWNTSKDGKGVWYRPGDTLTMAGDMTLYAQWSDDGTEVIVYFNANGGTGSVAPVIGIPGQMISFPSLDGYMKTGYTLIGWALSPTETDTSKIYGPSTTDQMFPAANTSYHAIWEADPAYLEYDGNSVNATDVPERREGVTDGEVTVDGPGDMARPGYTFTGWNTRADGRGMPYVQGDPMTLAGDVTLYAQWSADTVTVDFDLNGGSGTVPKQINVMYDDSAVPQFKVPAINAVLDGYSASVSWYTSADGTGTEYVPGDMADIPTESVTLYVHWIPMAASVKYDANGGSGNVPEGQTGVTGDTHEVPDQGGLTYDGYEFTGWNTSKDGKGVGYAPGATMIMKGNVTLYAQWRETQTVMVSIASEDGRGSFTYSVDGSPPSEYGGPFRAAPGSIVTISVSPDSGLRFVRWTVGDMTYEGTELTFAVPDGDVAVTAYFERIPGEGAIGTIPLILMLIVLFAAGALAIAAYHRRRDEP